MSYANQRDHRLLDRQAIREMLLALAQSRVVAVRRNSRVPSTCSNCCAGRFGTRARWLASWRSTGTACPRTRST